MDIEVPEHLQADEIETAMLKTATHALDDATSKWKSSKERL